MASFQCICSYKGNRLEQRIEREKEMLKKYCGERGKNLIPMGRLKEQETFSYIS
jgi:hypothetical protein